MLVESMRNEAAMAKNRAVAAMPHVFLRRVLDQPPAQPDRGRSKDDASQGLPYQDTLRPQQEPTSNNKRPGAQRVLTPAQPGRIGRAAQRVE